MDGVCLLTCCTCSVGVLRQKDICISIAICIVEIVENRTAKVAIPVLSVKSGGHSDFKFYCILIYRKVLEIGKVNLRSAKGEKTP